MTNNMSWITCAVGFVLFTLHLFPRVITEHSHDECYCLQTELDNLRAVVHVEHVTIQAEDVYLFAEQFGVIYKYNPRSDVPKLTPYINISHLIVFDLTEIGENDGLMSFAAHPDFTNNAKLYLYSVRDINDIHYIVVSEITAADLASEKILIVIEHRIGAAKGGQLLFGVDGLLYVFVSDRMLSGSLSESEAQNGENLLGKVLRLDINQQTVADFKLQYYTIPPDNPINTRWRPEVYAIGLANPWRCSVDKGHSMGRIICGEINDMTEEEINIIKPNRNYGHPYKEGMTCMVNKTQCDNIDNEELPIYSFNRNTGPVSVVIGGPIYRGSQFTSIQRQLLIGDAATGLLYTLEEDAVSSTWTLHNFTECSSDMCGCNYQSPKRRFLFSIGETFSDEPLLLMTDSPRPGDPSAAMLSLRKPHRPATCGSTGMTAYITVYLSLALLLLAFDGCLPLAMWRPVIFAL